MLRAIMIGDVVGEPGLDVLERRLPLLIKENSADFVIVNGENAAGGFGLTGPLFERILAAGADVVTSGNHIWEKREFWPVLNTKKRMIRPLNYPNDECPGLGWVRLEKPFPWGVRPGYELEDSITWLVINLQGREFMKAIDCPFKAFDKLEYEIKNPDPMGDEMRIENPVILVDFHAESTREKEALGYYLDGRSCVVAGTHTHVQTADERLLPGGTAYISDLGMTGALDGIIGMDPEICLDRARSQVHYRMETAKAAEGGSGAGGLADSGLSAGGSKTAVQGIIVEIDGETRKAISIKRFSV